MTKNKGASAASREKMRPRGSRSGCGTWHNAQHIQVIQQGDRVNLWRLAKKAGELSLTKMLVCAVALSLCFAQAFRTSAQGRKSEKEDSYTIRGTVLNSVTHAAIGRALVYSTDNRFAKMTDDQGHFEFKVPLHASEQPRPSGPVAGSGFSSFGVVPQGGITYSSMFFMARKPGYLPLENGQPGTQVDLGASSEITILLMPEALIIGHVTLSTNDGTDEIQVEIYRREVQNGRPHWVSAGTAQTRANGEFRIANLRKGEYKLFTHESLDQDLLTFNARGQLYGYPPVYYPAAADFEDAGIVHLRAGETFPATLTPSRREYYPVKVSVLNSAMGAGYNLTVGPQGHRGPGYSLGYDRNENAIRGMLPNGNYTVELVRYGENSVTGKLNFSVNGAAVEGPSLMLVPSNSIEVRLKDERTKSTNAQPGLLRNFGVMLVPREEFGAANPVGIQPPKSPEDETIVFTNVSPGSYWVRAGENPWGYMAAVNCGGNDLSRQPLVVGFGAATPPVEITIRDDGAQIDGNVENWRKEERPAAIRSFSRSGQAVVVFLPIPDSTGQFRQTWISSNGDFNLPQVPPGEYRVIAFDHPPEDLEYESAEALQKYQSKGQLLRVVADQKEHLRLTLNSGSE
jgi:hypothetical protein